MTFWRRFKFALYLDEPTAHEVAAKELENTKRELLAAARQREYYVAMEQMLQGRIDRLEAKLRTFI